MAFADLTANLNLNIANFSSKLHNASRQMGRFARDVQSSYGEAANALNKHNLQLKDTVRIIHGIVIAQTFYQAAGAITDATRSLWDFNVALDYMHVTYSALFGDTKVASDFMSVLQEHSVETIFDYQSLADASKKLLAYGIEYENLMFIMEGLTNLGAMSGDSAALDRIALALGQIYTKGKLSAEEMRQLANAYIPITEILQDKFGLTGDDLKRVGDLNLPASDVINAIVDYANENFGSVGDAAMYTITGLQNRIVDTLKVVGAQMLSPITTAYKSFLAYVSNGLEVLRAEFEAGGIGGVFEYLVPDEGTQQVIRQFIANIKNLFMAVVSVGTVAGQVFGNFASVFVTAFNIVSPIVIGFTNLLAGVLNAMLNTRTGATLLRVALVAAAGAFVVLRVHAVAALAITAVTKAVIGLSKALMLLAALVTRHPILALLAGLVIALVGVSAASSGANTALSGLFDTISGAAGGSSSGDVLQKTEQDLKDGADAADQFNNRLDGATDSADELADAVGGAGNAAKKAAKDARGLLSFDEVFKLPEKADSAGASSGGAGAGILDDIENLAAGLGGLGDALIPDIPDFSKYVNDFVDGLFGGLEQGIFDKLKSTGIGALIGGGLGAIIGGLLGGPPGAILGAKIGALAGGVVGLLWEALDGAIGNTVAGALAGIAAVIGKAFGSTFSSVLKTFITTGSFSGFFKSISEILKATGLKSIANGGIIGAAIGLVVDGIAHLLWRSLEGRFENADAETAKVGQTIGSVIGAVIGGIIGGPPGVIIGSAIGTFAGGFVGLFWEPIKKYFDPNTNALSAFFVKVGKDIADWAVYTVTELGTWFVDTYTGFSTWWTDTASGLSSWWSDTTDGFSTWWNDTKAGFGSWLEDTIATFTDWDSINSETLGKWWEETTKGFTTWWNDTDKGFTEWLFNTSDGFNTWYDNTISGLTTWVADTYSKINKWRTESYGVIAGWVTSALGVIVDWIADVIIKFDNWRLRVIETITNWKNTAVDVVIGFGIAAKEAIVSGIQNMLTSMSTKLDEIKTKWTEKWGDIKAKFKEWWQDLKKDMDTWLNDYVWKPIASFFDINNFWNKLKTLLDKIKERVGNWWRDLTKLFKDDDVEVTVTPTNNDNNRVNSGNAVRAGHAYGGVFNREHIARFAEGNKAEAIIPLENETAMRPFVDAVSSGIVGSLAPIVAQINANNANNLPPLYVGTLIADDRGLKQLYKKFEIIQIQEDARRGLAGT